MKKQNSEAEIAEKYIDLSVTDFFFLKRKTNTPWILLSLCHLRLMFWDIMCFLQLSDL